jgi:hypothetical protein
MSQIISTTNLKIKVSICPDKTSKRIKKLQKKPQNDDILKHEKLEQIVQCKSLKMFMDIDKEFKNLKVYKGKSSTFCKIKDLL